MHTVMGDGGFSFVVPVGWKLATPRHIPNSYWDGEEGSIYIIPEGQINIKINDPKEEGVAMRSLQVEVSSGADDGGAFFKTWREEPDSSLEPGAENPYKSKDMSPKQNITIDGYPGLLTSSRNIGSGFCYYYSLTAQVRKGSIDYQVSSYGCEFNYEKDKEAMGALLRSWKFN